MNNKIKNGGIAGKEIVWRRNGYGRLSFPDSTNYFGAVTSIFKATKTKSSSAGLLYWWTGLVQELGLEAAEEERRRILGRGKTIDWTAEQIIEKIEDFKVWKDSDVPSCYLNNEYLGSKGDERVLEWLLVNDVHILANEIPVWSRSRGVKGYLDYLVILEGGLLIVDFKGANKKKQSKYIDEPIQQISNYVSMLSEMWNDAKNGKDDEAKELLEQIPGLTDELFSDIRGMLLYFVDDYEKPDMFFVLSDEQRTKKTGIENVRKDANWKEDWKFMSSDWQLERFARKMIKYWTYPVVFLCDGTEGFFRRRWKRVQPENIIEPGAFKKMLSVEKKALSPISEPEIIINPNFKGFQ